MLFNFKLEMSTDVQKVLFQYSPNNKELKSPLKLELERSKDEILNYISSSYEYSYQDIKKKFYKPLEDRPIFISHSHNDRSLAISLANFLWDKARIKSFIDSEVWEYRDSIIDALNQRFNSPEKNTLDYEQTIDICTHLTGILTSVLIEQIDLSDSVFFLSTENSQKNNETNSSWIFLENYITNFLRKKRFNFPFEERESEFSGRITASKKVTPKFIYQLDSGFTIKEHKVKPLIKSLVFRPLIELLKNNNRKINSQESLDFIYGILGFSANNYSFQIYN